MTRAPVRDFLVGCFLLLGIGAMAYLSIRVGGLGSGPPGGFTLFATFDETGGLKPRAPVEISGVKVGQVKAINLDKTYRARVELDLMTTLVLPSDTSASIVTSPRVSVTAPPAFLMAAATPSAASPLAL